MIHAWVGHADTDRVEDGLVDAAAATVSVYDRGLRAGEGVFETVRTYGTHPFRLGAHLDRAAAGARVLGFPFPRRHLLTAAIGLVVERNAADGDQAVRLTVTPGEVDPASPFPGAPRGAPTVIVVSHPIADDERRRRDGVSVATVPWSRELPQVKAISHLAASLARLEAHRRGADDALLTADDGTVLEASYANVFAVLGGELVTPPVTAGLLAGVTRGVVLEVASTLGVRAVERRFTVAQLQAADEAFLTASTRELVPITLVDGVAVGDGVPGEVTRRVHGAFRDVVRREVEAAGSGRPGGP